MNWLSATLAVPYALLSGPGGWSDAADVTLTMRPQPASSMPGRNARTVRNGATASIWMVRTQSVRVGVRDERDGPEHAGRVDQDGGCPEARGDGLGQRRHGRDVRDVARDARDGTRRARRETLRLGQLRLVAGDGDDGRARGCQTQARPRDPGLDLHP